jgi:hypothetical protein
MSFKKDPRTGIAFGDAGVDVEFIKSVAGQKLISEMVMSGQVEQGFGSAGEESDAVRVMNLFFGRTMAAQKQVADDQKKAADLQAKLDKVKLDKLAAVGGEGVLRAKITEEVLGVSSLADPNAHTGGLISEGGIIRAQKGEIIIDDVLVNTFKTAAEVMSGMALMNLQRDTSAGAMQASSSPIIISNAPTTQINQSQPVIFPPSAIQPGNSDSPRLLN